MHRPYLSIVIITLNEKECLPRLLSDLKKQTWQHFEIIHVDSQSTDETVALSQEWSHQFEAYKIIEMDGRGVSMGRNTGASAALGERILFLDADTRLEPTFLQRALTELDGKNLDVAGVCMSGAGLPLRHRLGYATFNLGIRLSAYFFPTAIGACLFSTPHAHYRIEGFDEDVNLCEDCHYVLKAHKDPGLRYGMIRPQFGFDPRRLEQDGTLKTGLTYLRANTRRFLFGEMRQNEIPYQFGHYK